MELNITLTEMALFAWAIIATGFALKAKEQVHQVKMVLMLLLDNDDAREKMVAAHKNFTQGMRP